MGKHPALIHISLERESILKNGLLSSKNVKNYLGSCVASLSIGEVNAQEESTVIEKDNSW